MQKTMRTQSSGPSKDGNDCNTGHGQSSLDSTTSQEWGGLR